MSERKLIPVSALVTFGTIGLAELEEKGRLPDSRQWLGFVIAFLVVSAMADLGIPLGGGLAVLTMVAVLLARGDDALRFATGKVRRQRRPRRRGSVAPGPQRDTIQPTDPLTPA